MITANWFGQSHQRRTAWFLVTLSGLLMFAALSQQLTGLSLAASGGSTLTTSPVSVSLSTKPGTAISTDLQLQNNSSNPVEIAVHLQEFKASGEDGQAQIYEPPAGDPSLGWVHFSEDRFTAEPGVWHKIKMTIDTPKTAAFGYYYAVIFSPVSSSALIPGVNNYKGANAILVLLNAHAGGEKNLLEIASFNADQHAYQYLPATLSVRVRNVGNIYTAPRGVIYISRSPTGDIIDSLDVNKGLGNVLPGTYRTFSVQWDNGFPVYQTKRINGQVASDKQGKPVQELAWDFSHINRLRFGRYYARLVLVYSDGTKDVPLYATVSFWVIPWVPILVLLVVLILVGIGLWTVLRFTIKRRRPWRIRS